MNAYLVSFWKGDQEVRMTIDATDYDAAWGFACAICPVEWEPCVSRG